jgi:F0F1-type ATP synthase delta subunit
MSLMALDGQAPSKQLELPILVFGPIEVRRLQRELESLEEYIEQAEIRDKGKQPPLPKTSRLLDALAGNNNLNLLLADNRAVLKKFLKDVDAKAPVIHISFAADPSSAFTAKIVAWLRTNIHPYALLHLGLQPSIAAGCIVRTRNKAFDFSLRNRFHEQRALLLEAIGGSTGKSA